MPDFKTIGGTTQSWSTQHTASQRVADAGQKQAEYKIGGKLGGDDIKIRTGARVTRARGLGVWFKRKGSGIRDAFVRTEAFGIFPKSSNAAIRKKLQRNLRHAEHAFDRSINRLVEDLANHGKSVTPSETAQRLVDIRKKMADLQAAGKAAGDDRVDSQHLMDRLRRNLVDSLTVVAKAQPEKAQVIREQFEPGGKLANLQKDFGLLTVNEPLATKSDGWIMADALKQAASNAIGRTDDLSKLHQQGVRSMDDVKMADALDENKFPQLAGEFLSYADKEHTADNVHADRLLSRIYGPTGQVSNIKVKNRENMAPEFEAIEAGREPELKGDLTRFRDNFLQKNQPQTVNVADHYRKAAIREIDRYLNGNGDMQKLVTALDNVKLDNRDRISDTFGRFQPQLGAKWGKPAFVPGKQVGGPGGRQLSGPSDVGILHRTNYMLKEAVTTNVDDGLSTVFRQDVERKSKPTLIDTTGKHTVLHPPNTGHGDPYTQFTDFVNDNDPNVAKNLSQYLNQNAVKNTISSMVEMKDPQGNTVIPSLGDQNTTYTVHKDANDAFIVKYSAKPQLNTLVTPHERDENKRIQQLDPIKNHLNLDFSIRLTREDLAAGNGNFTYFDKPHWNATWGN